MYMLCMKQRTTIQIEYKTLEKLKKQRITKRETYDEILNRFFGLKKPKVSPLGDFKNKK